MLTVTVFRAPVKVFLALSELGGWRVKLLYGEGRHFRTAFG